MGELLKPFTSARALLGTVVSWGAPTSVAVFLYVLVVYESVQPAAPVAAVGRRLAALGIDGFWMAVGDTALISVVLAFNSRLIYEILEGYRGWGGWAGVERRPTAASSGPSTSSNGSPPPKRCVISSRTN